jgi:hypothetical protein
VHFLTANMAFVAQSSVKKMEKNNE